MQDADAAAASAPGLAEGGDGVPREIGGAAGVGVELSEVVGVTLTVAALLPGGGASAAEFV